MVEMPQLLSSGLSTDGGHVCGSNGMSKMQFDGIEDTIEAFGMISHSRVLVSPFLFYFAPAIEPIPK